jgi:phospholipid transport system transporter-binding protein
MLVQGLRQHKESAVVIDASALLRFDSSALAVLLEFRRECLAIGRHFSIQGLAPKLAELAKLYGIAELLPAA